MKSIQISEFTIDSLIESLESAANVANNVDYTLSKKERLKYENTEKTAPYALGYSKAAIATVIETLKSLKSNGNLAS